MQINFNNMPVTKHGTQTSGAQTAEQMSWRPNGGAHMSRTCPSRVRAGAPEGKTYLCNFSCETICLVRTIFSRFKVVLVIYTKYFILNTAIQIVY